MHTFTRVPTVAPGNTVTAVEMSALADAVNDRIRSGLGDPTPRIHYYLQAISRQIRNPDSGGTLFPAVDEARQDYSHTAPADGEWPLTGPGEPEGTNVASILGAFVFGSEALGVDSEDIRLADPGAGGIDMNFGSGSARELWELAKRQRGAIDIATGTIASPAFAAAQSHFAIIQSSRSPHGNAYGGYQPVPELLGDCGDGTSDTEPTPWVELKFSSLKEDLPDLTFEGYCSSNPAHVAAVLYFPGVQYQIWKYDGTVTILNWEDYIEGPYTFGNRLTKTWGNHLSRVLNFFVSEFAGTPDQVASEYAEQTGWLAHAFATHDFLTSQYHLAPQRGQTVGDGLVAPEYPQWQLTGATEYANGTVIPRSGVPGNTFATASGFLTTAILVYAQKLAGPCTVEIVENGVVIKSVSLTPDTAGTAQALVILPKAQAMTSLSFRTATQVRLTSTGTDAGIVCEATELWSYKPRLHDLALVIRVAAARMSSVAGRDGSGLDEEEAKEIWDDYRTRGCITSRRLHIGMPGSLDAINGNAVFDAARRLDRRCTRVIPRNNLVGYEVGADGKSVLYFRRLWNDTDTADVWDGIGPRRGVITEIEWGHQYRCECATGEYVEYDGAVLGNGATFTGKQGVITAGGTGRVYEAEGIFASAPPKGWSNEWVLDVMSLIPYQTLDTSVWKTNAFTDYVSMHFDRCTFEHPNSRPRALTNHFAYGAKEWVAPESLPAFRYAEGINALPCGSPDPTCEEARRRKLRSCQIGQLPLYIESVTNLIEDGEERVKVVLSGRLQHGSDAPATIDKDLSTWSLATIQAEIESGRTAENGIREYLMNQFVGGDCVGSGTQYGNAAHNSTVHLSLDVPFGACYPRIALTRLVPKPFTEGATYGDAARTPMESWPFGMIELYARAMCEGYVDRLSTEQYGCETGIYAVLDFSFESACFQAFGRRSFGVIQSAATYLHPEAETRPDQPLFHGPLPDTYPSAEIFNQFSAFWNLLTRVRIMLPLTFQKRDGTSQVVEVKEMHEADGTYRSCTTSQVIPGVRDKFDPVQPPDPTLGSYYDDTLASALYQMAIDDFACDGSGDWRLVHTRRDEQFKWSLEHSDYLEALPTSWQDMIETNGELLGLRETQLDWNGLLETTAGLGDECNGGADFWSQGGIIDQFPAHTEYRAECLLLPFSQRLIPPLPPRSVVAVGRVYSGGDLIYCVRNASGAVTVTPIPADALILSVELSDP